MRTENRWYVDELPTILAQLVESLPLATGSYETRMELGEALGVAQAAAERLRLEHRLLERVD